MFYYCSHTWQKKNEKMREAFSLSQSVHFWTGVKFWVPVLPEERGIPPPTLLPSVLPHTKHSVSDRPFGFRIE